MIIKNIVCYYGETGTAPIHLTSFCWQIHCYSIQDQKWLSTAIKHSTRRAFGIGKVSGKLVSIGGFNQTKFCGTLCFYNSNTGKWIDNNTPMPTPRVLPTVISQPTCLIVVGGAIGSDQSNWEYTNVVEVFSTSTSQYKWSQVDSLPIACACQTGGVSNGIVSI